MKNLIRLALLCALVGFALLSAQGQTPVASFAADQTNAIAGVTLITFTNQSSNATNYIWDFGDSNTSTNANPSHTYTTSAVYTVTLTAIGSGETNVLSIPNYITVTPRAFFLTSVAFGPAPLTVEFRNFSSGGATNYFWDFGDGNTSTNFAPTNTYSNAGTYSASLTALGGGGSNIFASDIHVGTMTATDILLNASFSFNAFVQGVLGNTNFVIKTAKPLKITNKEIINSIGNDLGKGTNNLRDAKLLLRVRETTNGANAGFIIREGTNDTDVSQYLKLQFPSQYPAVTTERANAKAAITNTIDYTSITFFLFTQNGVFNPVQGMLKLTSSSLVGKKREVFSHEPLPLALRADLTGVGLAGGAPAVYRGTFTAANRKIEVKEVPLTAP